jgi:Anti-sigma-D factor RsdA to sigma factor binding region
MTHPEDAAGHHLPGRNGPVPDECTDLPFDPAAVQADDALIDALGRIGAVPGSDTQGSDTQGSDAQLTQVLLAWRRDVRGDDDGDPDEPLVDVATALAVVARAQRPAPRTPVWWSRRVAVASSVALGLSGLGAITGVIDWETVLWPLAVALYAVAYFLFEF